MQVLHRANVFELKESAATRWADEFDDHTGAQLPGELVRAGKMEGIRWVNKVGLHKKIRRAEAKRRGKAIVPIRWVVTDKGGPNRPKVRCRLVGRAASEDQGNLAGARTLQCDASVEELESVVGTSRWR